jgi:hypothetical protein
VSFYKKNNLHSSKKTGKLRDIDKALSKNKPEKPVKFVQEKQRITVKKKKERNIDKL